MTAGCPLQTARLLLRSYEHDDIDRMLPLIAAREVAATTLRIPHPYHREDAEKSLAAMEEDFAKGRVHAFAILETASGDFCGGIRMQVEPDHERAEVGYWFGVPYWGRGYATEAVRAVVDYGFHTLHLNRIYATVFSGNVASRRVAEKAGMTFEGCLRQHAKKWGVFQDVEFFSVLASEFHRRLA